MNKLIQNGLSGIALLAIASNANLAHAKAAQPNIGSIVGTNDRLNIVCNPKGLVEFRGYFSDTGVQYFAADADGKFLFVNEKPAGNPYLFLEKTTKRLYFDITKDGTFDYFLDTKNSKGPCKDLGERI